MTIDDKDSTDLYNRLVLLYFKTKSKKVEEKCFKQIWRLVDKTMHFCYYGLVKKKHVFRNDNEDMVNDCVVRLMTRIKKWKDNKGKPYLAKSLKAVEKNEIVFALYNEKQVFLDKMESWDDIEFDMINEEEKENDLYC